MSQVPTMDTDKERGGRDSRRSEARLSDSLEFLDRQSSLQIKQSRQSNERLIQEYRNNDNNNLPKQRWSQGQVTQINNSYRDSGNYSQPKYIVQDMNTTTVERHDDPEKSVFTSFPGYVADDTKHCLWYDAGQTVSDGTAGRPLWSRWADDWVEQLDDMSKEPAPVVRLQPIRIELQSQPMEMPVERMTQSSDPNTSLSSGDVPMAMSHWLEEQDWRRQCEREEHLVRMDTSSYQTEVITDQQPRDHNSHVGTRRRIKSAGPVMSGASRFGWTTSDEEGDRGRSLSFVTDPKRSLRRQWTTEWVGQPGYRNERKLPSSRSLPPIRIQGEFRPVNRQRSDPYWTGQLENRNEGYKFPSSRSLPPTHKQGDHQPVSRQRSDPYWTGQLENRNEGYKFPSSRSLPPTHKQGDHQPVSRQRSDPYWTGQLENRNEGDSFPSSRSMPPLRKQGHEPVSRQRSDPYWKEQLETRNEGDSFPSSRSLPPIRKQGHEPVSRQRSDPYWTGQLENRNEGYNVPSSRSMPPLRKQGEHQPVSRQRSDPYWTGQLETRNEGDSFPSSRSLQPVRKQEQGEHQPASRHRSDPGTRQRNS
ncbi:uncharacterized protein [Branchiostoma lanceolatum]|uniref:uncharacterized protein n=1 Tax=Branchiostoma lanceolatum TaxID=7740 RepID=UPI003452C37D